MIVHMFYMKHISIFTKIFNSLCSYPECTGNFIKRHIIHLFLLLNA